MVSGAGAAEHEAAKVAEGIIAREAKDLLREAEQVGAKDAAATAERDLAARAEKEAADRVAREAEEEAARRAAFPQLERTGPSGSGTYSGRPTTLKRGEANDVANVRGNFMENKTPHDLTDQGFRVHQNPTPAEIRQAATEHGDIVREKAKPDYLIEGKVFDSYGPTPDKTVGGITSVVEKKVADQQTQRVAVNLTDWNGNVSDLVEHMNGREMPGVKEVMLIQADGSLIHYVRP